MTKYTPYVRELGEVSIGTSVSIERLEKEVSVYAASPAFIRKNCGPIANAILDAVPAGYYADCRLRNMLPNIDVRVHRLNVGEYPAVPGWHCDGALRETYFAAPALENIKVRRTVLCTVSTGCGSNFEYLSEDYTINANTWADLDKALSTDIVASEMTQDNVLYEIGETTIHRATPALVRGWRLFFRMSMWHNDYLGEEGMIAKQQQVYVPFGNGW